MKQFENKYDYEEDKIIEYMPGFEEDEEDELERESNAESAEESTEKKILGPILAVALTGIGAINDIRDFITSFKIGENLLAAIYIALIFYLSWNIIKIFVTIKAENRKLWRGIFITVNIVQSILALYLLFEVITLFHGPIFVSKHSFTTETGEDFDAIKLNLKGKGVEGKLDEENSEITYYFELNKPAKITIDFSSDCIVTPKVVLYEKNIADKYIINDVISESGMMINNLSSGIYYVKVCRATNNDEEGLGKFEITANSEENIYGEIIDSKDEYKAVEILTDETPVYGFMNRANDIDYFYFNLDKASNITLKVTKDYEDYLEVEVCDDKLETIENTISPSGVLTCTMNAGKYYVIAKRTEQRPESWGIYGFTLSATESEYGELADSKGIGDATILATDGTAMNGRMSKSNDVDYYTFNVESVADVTVHFSCEFEYGPYVALRNKDDVILNDFFNESGNLSSTLQPGKYYISVERDYHNNSSAWGIYTVSVKEEASKYGEVIDSITKDDAVKLELNGSAQNGNLNMSNEVDYYFFTLDKTSDVTIHYSDEIEYDPEITLCDKDEKPITNYLNESGNMAFTLNSGKYYVVVKRDYHNNTNTWGMYSLEVKSETSQYDEIVSATTKDDAIELEVDGDPIAGSMSLKNEKDYYEFTLEKTSDVAIHFKSQFDLRPNVVLCDEDENPITDHLSDTGSMYFSLNEGKYYIRVEKDYHNNINAWGIYMLDVQAEESSYEKFNTNNDTQHAEKIKLDGTEYAGIISMSNDKDCFGFELDESAEITVNVKSEFERAADYVICDKMDRPIEEFEKEDGVRTYNLSKGKYYIYVTRDYRNGWESWGVYTIAVNKE